MIDHISISVTDLEKSKDFYKTVLEPLGYGLLMEFEGVTAGFGRDMKPSFWIHPGEKMAPAHIAFASPNRATINKFYEVAIKAGATDNGKPGVRPQYHPAYYGAFVLDPDGHNIEAVSHVPE